MDYNFTNERAAVRTFTESESALITVRHGLIDRKIGGGGGGGRIKKLNSLAPFVACFRSVTIKIETRCSMTFIFRVRFRFLNYTIRVT